MYLWFYFYDDLNSIYSPYKMFCFTHKIGSARVSVVN